MRSFNTTSSFLEISYKLRLIYAILKIRKESVIRRQIYNNTCFVNKSHLSTTIRNQLFQNKFKNYVLEKILIKLFFSPFCCIENCSPHILIKKKFQILFMLFLKIILNLQLNKVIDVVFGRRAIVTFFIQFSTNNKPFL